MNSFAELVMNRRSIRKYTEELLSPQEVELILKSVLTSPSSKHSNSWQFVVVENKEILRQLSLCKSSGCSFLEHCALAIVVLTDPMQSGAYIEDAAIAATYIQLQAEDLGLGSCWVQISGRQTGSGQDSEEYVRTLLNIPLQLHVGCIISLGHKEKPAKPHVEEDLQWEKVHLGGYNPENTL